jgi:hypothetical protein
MAKNSRGNRSVSELMAEIAGSRERLGRDLRGLRYELDLPAKLRRSFREQTVSWLAAAAAVGALIILLPLRRKKIYVDKKSGTGAKNRLLEAGFVLGALKIAAGLARPVIVEFVKNRLFDFASQPRATRKRERV